MGFVLSERNKTLAGSIVFGLILTMPILFLLHTRNPPPLKNMSKTVLNSIDDQERKIGEEIDDLKFRADQLYKRFRVSVLRYDEMLPGESLVIIKDGVIDSYFGEVFYFKSSNIKPGEWKFIKKEDYLYFIDKFDENVYYIKKYKPSENIFKRIKDQFPFISEDINFYSNPSYTNESGVQYDNNTGVFYVDHLSANGNNQIFLVIKFSAQDYFNHWKVISGKKFFLFYLIFVLLFMFLLPSRMKYIKFVTVLIFIIAMFFLLRLYANNSIYLKILGFEIRSIYFFFYFSVLYFLAMTRGAAKIKNERQKDAVGVVTMVISLYLSVVLIKSLNFAYTTFSSSINYLIFILSMFIIFLIPFKVSGRSDHPRKRFWVLFLILFNILFILFSVFILHINFIVPVILSLMLLFSILHRNNLFMEIIRVLMISISIFLVLLSFSESEKKDFISVSLKNIFSNQNNYAKFISRELIHNIHLRNEDLTLYFDDNKNMELEKIWRRSIAMKENIASGIFVISADDNIINSFSYRIPYLNVVTENMFPFWMIDEFKAEYFGRTISIAVASINIFKESKYLGKIIIQVMNSSDLITRDHPDSNIFTLDDRINGDDISYIKLNSKMQVIENPSNIDIRNLNRSESYGKNWIEFDFMETKFVGYMFESNEDTLIVFFPRTSISGISANIIKIFLLLLVVNGFLNFRKFLNSGWKIFLRTFSFKVFVILILISLFSAITFSLFTIQFNRRNREVVFRREIFNSGGVAYNIIGDIIQQNSILEKDDLFFLSKILSSDISIYKDNKLMDTSNYNKIINSEIPVLVSSRIPELLEESEKFFMDRESDSSRIFFKISDYIVRLDFTGTGRDILTGPEIFSNFIVNLFFVLTVIGILLAFLFRRKILSPINILNNKMSMVGIGELEEIAEMPGEIEIKNLFKGFNSMISGIREQKKNVSDIARMKTLIKISRWIAHEVKNPLTPIKLSAEQILKSLKDKRVDYEDLITESVRYIIEETDHLRNISLGFLDISNLDKIDVSKFDLSELCKNEIFKLKQVYKDIEFRFESGDNIPEVRLDKVKITQILKNLLTNSVESIKSRNGKIILSLHVSGNNIDIRLKDNGSGIEGIVLDKLFDEDFSTKSSGTGLGLFIVKRIIDLHKGSIIYESGGSGTIVKISLPLVANGEEEQDD